MKREYNKFLLKLTDDFGDWFTGKYEIPTMTNKLYPYKEMFSPITVNNLTIKNRLVMGPMGNIDMCEETGRPSQKMISYFEERAKGGVGLITTGLVPTTFGIDSTIKELGDLSYFPRIDRSRTVFSGWRDLAHAVHSHGSHIFIQLTAGLGRVGNPQCLITQFKLPVSASWNPNYYIPQIPCKRLSTGKCKKIIKKTGQASADAKAALIDGVYIHGHEGYLIEQLTNPAFNRRVLGRYANYQNFGIDMVNEIRNRVGKDYPIMYRIDLSLVLNETYQENMQKIKSLKKFKNERTIEQTLDYMKNLVLAGVDMFDVDLGCYDNWWLPHPPASMPSGCYLSVSELVKNFFKENNIKSNKGLEVPVVAVGKLGYPDLAEKALRDNKCDMVMLARPLLADAQWPNKAYAGNVKDIRPCIGCHEACIKEFVEGGHPQCAVCATTAFEDEFHEVTESSIKKKIAVIGAGPSGAVAAITLLQRGHSVDLYDKNKTIGGTLNPASVPKIKYELKNYVDYLVNEIDKLKTNKKFTLNLGVEATEKLLKDSKYDTIIFATGSSQIKPNIEGVNAKNVYTAIEVLNNKNLVKNAKDITIIGGGDSGCEAAYYLKYELNKNVNIIEMGSYLMHHTCTANRGHLLYYLNKGGVNVYNRSKVLKINEDNTISIQRNVYKKVPNPFNTWQPILPENIKNPFAPKIKEKLVEMKLKSDIVILSAGTIPNNSLYFSCVKNNVAKEILNIGDSFTCGKVFNAVKSAYRTAVKI